MERKPFGKTGLMVSPLGFGGSPFAYLGTEQKQVATTLNLLLDAGVNLIDTAASYPGSEEAIAKAVGHRRDEFVLVSKCGQEQSGVDAPAWSAKVIEYTVEQALRRLATDRLDVMLLHSCGREVLEEGDAFGTLIDAKAAGKIRFAGYSGDNETAVYAAGLEGVSVIETSINLADQINIELVLPETRAREIGVLAKRPIANAAWKNIADQPGYLISYAATYTDRLKEMHLNLEELGLTGPPEKTWPELALRFTISQSGVHVAIIGTTNPDNARANLAAVEKGPLPDDTVRRIRDAFSRADPEGAWKGKT